MLIIDLSDPARLILLHCSFMFIRIKGMTLLLVRSTHIYYIMCLRAACLAFCSQSVKDRVSCPPFRKASAKVRPFFILAKSFTNFFREKWEKSGNGTKRWRIWGGLGQEWRQKQGKANHFTLDEISTCRKFRQVRQEGKRMVNRPITMYNLDMIISDGYRVNTKRGVKFRLWLMSLRL